MCVCVWISLSLSLSTYIYIYIYTHYTIVYSRGAEHDCRGAAPRLRPRPEKGEVLLRGVGAPRYRLILSEKLHLSSAQLCSGSPEGLTVRAKRWFLGARFLGAPPISLT